MKKLILEIEGTTIRVVTPEEKILISVLNTDINTPDIFRKAFNIDE